MTFFFFLRHYFSSGSFKQLMKKLVMVTVIFSALIPVHAGTRYGILLHKRNLGACSALRVSAAAHLPVSEPLSYKAPHLYNDHVDVLDAVADIATYTVPGTTALIVKDTLRGGFFQLYSGPDLPDNGMVFSDALKRKWLRQTSNDFINVQWYGARSYIRGLQDNINNMTPLFYKAINYIYTHSRFNTLYIPQDKRDYGAYYLSDPLIITQPIRITGDGTTGFPKTSLLFAAHTSGFIFNFPYGKTLFSAEMKNLLISGGYDGTFNTSKHAITLNNLIDLDNIVIAQFDGDGIHISACQNVSRGDNDNYGNADAGNFRRVKVENCTNGFFIEGCDANILHFDNIVANQNRRWGIYDNGQLGNFYIQPHMAFNGHGIAGAKTVVVYKGISYVALPGHDGYFRDQGDSNYNKPPDQHTGTFWEVTDIKAVNNWMPNTRYFSGGPLVIQNPNARPTILGPYTEGFQPRMRLGARSLALNGDQGSGTTGGINLQVLYGRLYMPDGGIVLPTPGQTVEVGKENPYTPATLYAYQPNGMPAGLLLQGQNNSTSLTMRNSNDRGLTGGINYTGNDMAVIAGGTPVLYVGNLSGASPAITNTYSLGIPDLLWKDIWGVNYHAGKMNISTGSGSASVGTGTLSSGTATINSTAVTASSKIFVTLSGCSNCGTLYISAVAAGKSFTVSSSSKTDASNFNWWIVN